ncbi:MAG TPA: enoyl-CoA hydratase/isomerase family protein [Burkholderiales bacterium]|jgi:enoyl-CoA hydratase/carnithine racemase|nr:enoyl-CoA hydratase/isomerase family protein [Burkholderiales bacterium]HEX2649425.1 enoyl-CoA hydratase/isomerase family protein [Burkholderiales bacterium]
METTKDVAVELSDFVATVEICRPPHNFFDFALIQQLADAFEALDRDPACRAIVLCAQGKSFCAGANLSRPGDPAASGQLYLEAVRLFRCGKPVVGAIQGPAIGGGLGLALVPDFRVACAETRFAANFTVLGFHPGFGLTVTLPELVGKSKAALMFYTSRRIKGEEALAMGLADLLVPQAEVRSAAFALAREIATCAPLAVIATRATLRQGLADRVKAATDHELKEQTRLRQTEDFKEGVKASAERRPPRFSGR